MTVERPAEVSALAAPARRQRMLVIVNPHASTVSPRLRRLVVAALHGRYDVEAVDTEGPGHATELCRAAAHDGCDVVASFGGDGTVNEAANGLAGSATALTCLPGGATNVLCRMLGIPADVVDATEHLLAIADDWRPRRIDLATVNGRCFTFSGGCGLDADVVKRIESRPGLKRRLSGYWFVYAALSTALRRYAVNAPRIDVDADGRTARGVAVLVQNGDPFTYLGAIPVRIAEGAALDGGTLAAVALQRASPIDVPAVVWRLLSTRRRVADHPRVTAFGDLTAVRCAAVDGRPFALQADGEYIGDATEASFGIRPGALAVIA